MIRQENKKKYHRRKKKTSEEVLALVGTERSSMKTIRARQMKFVGHLYYTEREDLNS